MDVLNYTTCTINFACDSTNAAMCATTSGTTIRILRSNATSSTGSTVIIKAFISGNTAAGIDGVDHSTSATLTVNTKPDCSMIDTITSPSTVALDILVGTSYT